MSDEFPHSAASDAQPAAVPPAPPAPPASPAPPAWPAPPAKLSLAARQPLLEWVAVLLGALTFVWGFLDWYGWPSGAQNGYRLLDGYPPIGFALLAALFAGVNLSRSRTEHLAWLSIGTSFLAVVFTIVAMAVKPTFLSLLEALSSVGGESRAHLSVQYGLILTLVTTILQLLCLVGGWLVASGRLALVTGGPGPRPSLEAPTMPMPGPSAPPSGPSQPWAPPPAPEPPAPQGPSGGS